MGRTKNPRDMKPEAVKAWFAVNGATMRVVMESEPEEYVSENESIFIATDGSRLVATVSYEEGCPTCGGAYVKRWTLFPAREAKP